MRLNECQEVQKTLQEHLGISLTVIDGAALFLDRLKGVSEPETKRKIIGGTFIDLFEQEAIRIEKEAENTANAGKVEFFVQGTLYPDVIESLSFNDSTTIKSKHTSAFVTYGIHALGSLYSRLLPCQSRSLFQYTITDYKHSTSQRGRPSGSNDERRE